MIDDRHADEGALYIFHQSCSTRMGITLREICQADRTDGVNHYFGNILDNLPVKG